MLELLCSLWKVDPESIQADFWRELKTELRLFVLLRIVVTSQITDYIYLEIRVQPS